RNDEIPMLYIHHNGEDFAIANIGDDVTTFNLNFRAATMGRYTMNVKTDGDFSYLHLIDAVTGEDVDMLIDEEYSFIGAPSDKENRFIVKLDYNTSVSSTGSESFAYQNGNDLMVSGEGELQIFDVTGRLVMKQSVNGVGSVSTSSLQTGVYILRLIGADVKTQKIVVK
ncbi:MAG: T9SS type A sorting domain-containing protein, partial [Bacteroidales bacterium]|nr:T9SS type A sorting domain-containing protein [Bacteroidales bacterium]